MASDAPTHRIVGFKDSVKLAFINFFNFKGRSSRGAYWFLMLFTFIGFVVLGIADAIIFGIEPDDLTPITFIFNLIIFIPSLSVSVRRLHDIGRSGWWFLLTFTVIGYVLLFWWWAQPGERNANKYGEDVEAGR